MWITAIAMGLAGSMHCVGMCSPLSMAVTQMTPSALINRMIYNAGRILTYGILGAVVSSVGFLLPLFRFQNVFSICFGIIIILMGFGILHPKVSFLSTFMHQITVHLKALFAQVLKRKGKGTVFLLGALNGLLPCGLVLLALSYSVTARSPMEGILFMLTFGAGTVPAMLGFTTAFLHLVKRLKADMTYVNSGMLILSGVVLIAQVFFIHGPHLPSGQGSVIDIVLCK